MQDNKTIQFNIEDKLQSECVKAHVSSFFQNGKANVAIDFENDEDRIGRLIEFENYVTNEGIDAEVDSFFTNCHLRVLITLNEEA